MSGLEFNHVVYWTIPLVDGAGAVVSERHYALNLTEIDPTDAAVVEGMLRSYVGDPDNPDDVSQFRTDPKITGYRHLFKPFIEVKKRSEDLCRFTMVWLPFHYAEYSDDQTEPRHHRHPSVRPLAGVG